METRKAPRWLLRWSLAGLFAASLWLGAYFGGRHTGFDGGHAEGFIAAQPEGLAAGHAEGIRQSLERYKKKGVYEDVYEVSHLLSKGRSDDSDSQTPDDGRPVEDLDWLIHEIVTTVSPENWPEFGGTGGNSIRGFPTNQCLVVSAEAADHAKIAILLQSKDDDSASEWWEDKP